MIRRWRLRRELERELAWWTMAHNAEILRLRLRYEAEKQDLERRIRGTYKRPR